VTHQQAAALPTAGLSSLQALRAGGVEAAHSGAETAPGGVLVIGASGGCGHLGVQLAKAMGCKFVVGVCSGG